MDDLRARLNEITENGKPETHPQLVEQLRPTHHHTIEVLQGAAHYGRYTCAMHAFDLIEDPEYIAIALVAPRDIFASPRFVERLIAHGSLVELPAAKPGALVVYVRDGTVRHIGRLIDEARVESKWGIGQLYRHGLLEVPLNYGSVVRFFEPIDRDFVLDRYVEYARENGVRFKGDPEPEGVPK